uniref:Amino acid transporter transmembrane domain-containing protein n=1 Tax=Romanomermis culicivorax TaxID=13658 RepID=A0A915ICR7_ROMCU
MILLPLIFVNLIRELKMISILAALANLILLFGLIIILQACFLQQPNQLSRVKLGANFFDTMLFVGTAMYTFEGQAASLLLFCFF